MTRQASWVGARSLLKRLRDVMAGGGEAQDRLDHVVRLIAADMVAEVCSIYIRRAGDVLELYATEGLRREAVHKTRLRVGEGLVGTIAGRGRPLALAEAQSHPAFAYRPETGEEAYHSLMGVPILRGGRVLGVLVVQNKTPRQYGEEEIETMETIAMVLAEMAASGDLIPRDSGNSGDGRPVRLQGVRLSAGLATGRAWLHMPYIAIPRLVAENPAVERDRLDSAFQFVRSRLESLMDVAEEEADQESRDILETYNMFANDAGWLNRIGEAISSGLTAEAAISRIQEETRRRMAGIADSYLRERMHDFDDLANRLLLELTGVDHGDRRADLPENAVIVARNLSPAELLEFPRDRLSAILLEEGSSTAHVAIVARALELPVIGGIENLFASVEPGDEIVVDGDNGQAFVRPGPDVHRTFAESIAARRRQREAWAKLRDLPAESRDGVVIELHINAGLLIDLPQLAATGARGIGLYRTELPFMVRSEFPDVDAQRELYRRVIEMAGAHPVVFRTLDIGGDKPVPYLDGTGGDNPALGWRALRVALDRPTMLRDQVRALIEASAERPLRLMFPMVAEVAEFETARHLVEGEVEAVKAEGGTVPSIVEIGAMVEVPALVWQLPALFSAVDFISVGSNDLVQFLFASDRTNPRLADRYDPLSPSVLSVLRTVASSADAAGVPVSVCGEMAGEPLEALALVALGFRALSMQPSSVGRVKAMIRSLPVSKAADFLADRLSRPDHSLRADIKAFAHDHEIVID